MLGLGVGDGELALLFDGARDPSSPSRDPARGAQTAVGHLPCAKGLEKSRVWTRSFGSLRPGGGRGLPVTGQTGQAVHRDGEHSGCQHRLERENGPV